MKVYKLDPVAAPRQVRRDKWDPSPAVMKYRSFRDAVKLAKVQIKESRQHIIFHVAMPDSWSKKKRAIFLGQPHQQTPDVDNFLKALLDSVFGNDSHVWDIRASKVWGEEGMIIVEDINDS